eukprot:1478988-Amphidinium_carterae.1
MAWDCWNSVAVEALGLQAGDRGTLKVRWATSPTLPRPDMTWSVPGPYVSTQESQKARLEEVRLKATKERQKASKAGWEKFVKEAAENSPSKLFKWVRGSTRVWDLAVRTTGRVGGQSW